MTDFSKRIAFLILPLRDNDGNRLTETHAALREAILDNFGGYTQTLVTGAWRNGDGTVVNDDSLKYEIAMTTGAAAGKKLVQIAAEACRRARQACVMVQLAGSTAHFINAEGDML
jgi:hypothetical protein